MENEQRNCLWIVYNFEYLPVQKTQIMTQLPKKKWLKGATLCDYALKPYNSGRLEMRFFTCRLPCAEWTFVSGYNSTFNQGITRKLSSPPACH